MNIERKYIIDLIPVKNYLQYLAFLVSKKLEDITNNSLKLEKMFLQYPIPVKANSSLYSNASQYFGLIIACKKLASSIKRYRKNFIILKTNRLSNSSSAQIGRYSSNLLESLRMPNVCKLKKV